MRGFWSSAIYRNARYQGRPLEVHRAIAELRPEHLVRWRILWEQAVQETVRVDGRQPLIAMAQRMAEAMDSG